ncbi:IS5 family transposase [Bacteroidales bacterium OttesenSCG-928-I21]|nr:IS5 family transposase [Bacteroidales bacterium OttesenSCG-928-I21]
MHKTYYPSNLTEKQWSFIENLIEPNKKRKRKYSLRDIFNAILYVTKSGCQWRMLPIDFAPWNTVYFYYRKWKLEGVIEQIHEFLRDFIRKKLGRNQSPSLGIIDSRSVKTSRQSSEQRGYDGGKNVKGRKQHIIVDTLGLLLVVVVHSATTHDSRAAFSVIERLKNRFPRLKKIIADGGYRGDLAETIKKSFGWVLQVVLRSDTTKKFEVLPKRWIVERTFAWLEGFRRLSKDYEVLTDATEHMIMLAMIKIMLNKI